MLMRTLSTLVAVPILVSASAAQGVVFEHFGTGLPSYGTAVAGLGDLDGDGFGDYAFGGPTADTEFDSAGTVKVISAFTQQVLYEYFGDADTDVFGRIVEAAGDIDEDGVPDFILGSSLDESDALNVYSGVDGSLIYNYPGNSGVGFAVDAGGGYDVNNDGVPDFIVSSPFDDTAGSNHGAVRVYSGADGGSLWFRTGTEEFESMGTSAAALIGDIDGDGFSDFAGGTSLSDFGGNNNIGHALLWSGQTGAVIHDHHGDAAGDFMGSDIAALGDVDDDGFGDVIIGASGYGPGQLGRVIVYSGEALTELWHFNGTDTTQHMGLAVARVGDIDGDGLPEVIGGGDGVTGEQGRVEVRSGVDGAPLGVMPHANNLYFSGHFGAAVDGLPDGNGDGVPDVVIGVPDSQRVLVYSVECGQANPYGSGCPGSGGVTPTLDVDGCRTPGGTLSVRLEDGPGATLAWLFVGLSPAADVLPSGCVLNVGNVLVTIPLPLDGNGELELPETLALGTPLASVFLQSFVQDGGVAQGYSASRGLELVIE